MPAAPDAPQPGFARRTFVLGAAVTGTAIAAWHGARQRAEAAEPDDPRSTTEPARPKPAQQAAVRGNTVPAFPGCEGAGKFTTGGRGGEVYEVTTLADSGPGSLRDAVSGGDRIVVFRVGGTIELTEGLSVTGNNITIAGQTAPGGGIAVTNNEFQIEADNVIVRYLRMRAGDRLQPGGIDTFNGRGHRNIVIDHCSVGWGVDECFSLYGNYDVTVSNCIIHEGLAMSNHLKGLHGYGGLWGGENVSYHNNLFIHQGARQPRFSFTEDMEMRVDHRNNVVYDHGFSSVYGAEWCEGINVVGNYYKPGPATLAGVASHIIEPYRGGSWYLADNKVEGFPDITADNTLGIAFQAVGAAADPALTPQVDRAQLSTPGGGINLLAEPARTTQPLPDTMSADEAYQTALRGVGASLPLYDSVDARLVYELRTGTGRLINSQNEVGGYPELDPGEAPVDSNHDGIPDDWAEEHGLDADDPDHHGTAVAEDGYCHVEHYVNGIEPQLTEYPTVSLSSPDPDLVVSQRGDGQQLSLTAEAATADGASIESVQFYANEQVVGEATAAPYRASWRAPVGTWYLSARVVDSRGAKTQSTSVPVHVNRTSGVGSWTSRDIGDVALAGSARRDTTSGDLTITGSGKIRGGEDAFQFLHQPITAGAGDVVEIMGRIDTLSRPWEGVFAGFMFRESLRPSSPFFTAGVMVYRDGLKGHVRRVQSYGPGPALDSYPTGVEDVLDVEPQWIRLVKRGDEFEAHLSPDSLQWTRIGYERIAMKNRIFVGLAIDANKEDNDIEHYASATFHRVSLHA